LYSRDGKLELSEGNMVFQTVEYQYWPLPLKRVKVKIFDTKVM